MESREVMVSISYGVSGSCGQHKLGSHGKLWSAYARESLAVVISKSKGVSRSCGQHKQGSLGKSWSAFARESASEDARSIC